MENRRPPRPSSSSRRPSFDRGRGAQPYRGGKFGGDGKPNQQRRNDGPTDGRGQDRNLRNFDPQRADRPPGGNFNRNDGPGYARRRFGPKPNDARGRPANRKQAPPDDGIKITSDAQVTDGKFRGKTLLNSDSPYALPTPRKVREIMFKIIARRVKARRFLDLGSGVGTIGIEAISRGAMLATFVERSARCCTMLKKNLDAFGIKDGHGELAELEILPFLHRSAKRKRVWDLIYFDLNESTESTEILDRLSRGGSLSTGGLLLIQHPSEVSHPETFNQLKRWRTVEQGETIVSIYERI